MLCFGLSILYILASLKKTYFSLRFVIIMEPIKNAVDDLDPDM